MPGFQLRKSMVFDWSGTSFRIDRLHPGGDILLERIGDGNLSIVPRQQLLAEYSAGRISGRDAETEPTALAQSVFSRPLDELPSRVRQEAIRRMRYIEGILDHGKPIFTNAYLRPLICQIAVEIGDSRPPGVTSIYRWYRRYQIAQDTRSLIPRIDRRGRHSCGQSECVLRLMSDAVHTAFKASPQATGKNIYSRLISSINSENQRRLPAEQLKRPSLRTVYRLLGRMDAYEQVALREGKAAADKRFRINKRGVLTNCILERVEIDHTPLDLFLIDEKTSLPLGRPTLTVVIDHFSRMLLGFYLSFDNPSTAAVMGALRHAILPKTSVRTESAGLLIEHPWPCFGRPDVMVVDNGLEFHGASLESVAYDLGIRIQYCPKHQPRFKGVVERYLKTINYFFAQQLPGTSFARFHHRGDYDPQRHALLTLSEFNHLFEKWVVDVYAQTLHRGIGCTPWAKWFEGLNRREPELPADIRALKQRIGLVTTRSLRRDGILLDGIRYNGEALGNVLRAYGEGVKVRVLSDSEDLGDIQVWGPNDVEPVCVEAVELSYARGLTKRQNDAIRELQRDRQTASENPVSLEQARGEMEQWIGDLLSSRKQRNRRRAAAIRGASSKSTEAPSSPPKQTVQFSQAQPTTEYTDQTYSELPDVLPVFRIRRTERGES